MRSAESLIDQLTLEEQVSLLSGQDFWSVNPIERLGIGTLRVTDGPNGARGSGSLIGSVSAAAFPVGIAIGASWNPDLAQEIGEALAEEVKTKDAHVSLAPTVNIHRSVTNGRNFECYAEDPHLTSHLAVSHIRGLQSQGIGATIKHFVGNESEIERTTMSSDVDERTLREVYLLPFEAAVKEAGVWAVMTSYNRLNGTFTSEHSWLLTEVLRGEWGFDGLVMSDWFGSHSTSETLNAGLDLEMPGPPRNRGAKLLAAVERGEVSRATVRERALSVLRLIERVGLLDGEQPHEECAENRPSHRALIRRAGAEGTVLMKNDCLLPLEGDRKIAVIGPNAKVARIMGGGSAQLKAHYSVSPWDGLAAQLGENALLYAPGCTNHHWEPLWRGELTATFYGNRDFKGEPAHEERMQAAEAIWIPPFAGGKVDDKNFSAHITGRFRPGTSGLHRFGVHAAGYARLYVDGQLVTDVWENWKRGRTFFEEGCDPVVGEMVLEAGRTYEIMVEFASRPEARLLSAAVYVGIGVPMGDTEIEEAAQIASEADVAIVFAGRSGEWDTEGSDLEDIRLPGRQDDLIGAVAAANPRTAVVLQTGGPVEMPWVDDVPAILQAWYPGQEAGNAIADVLLGRVDPGGRLPQTFPKHWRDNPTGGKARKVYPGEHGHVIYEEGVYVGYRAYERDGIAPLFPFGHGLSYTTFALSELRLDAHADALHATFRLVNTGARQGSTVAQLYASAPVGSDLPRRLVGFAKCRLLPGESKEVTIVMPDRSFARFDETAGTWCIDAGSHEIGAGFSWVEILQVATVQLSDKTLDL